MSVKNAAGLPSENVAVSLTQTGETQSTTSDGCAFFAFENVGHLHREPRSGAGYVSDQGVATPTQSATVQVGGTTSIQFQYDRAATLTLTLRRLRAARRCPTSPGVPVSLGNTHILPTGVKVVAGTGTTRTIGSLFPYTDGWETWAGSCSDADPEGVKPTGGPYYVGASRTAPISVTPGGTSSGVVTMPALTVQTRTTLGAARHERRRHRHPRRARRRHGRSQVPGGRGLLARDDGRGREPARSAMPYGKWTISAAGTSTTFQDAAR